MEEYHELVRTVLNEGQYKENRTGVDTISYFNYNYTLDNDRYPLLTTKKMNGYRWNSMIHELLWYLSGEEHIRNLREETKIWDAWADEEGHLDTAYGRFWRRYPVPNHTLEGESWAMKKDHRYLNVENAEGIKCTFDQLQYVIDELQENPNSRRLVVNAWHPANAAVSTLPPCHYTFVFNVQGDELNLHLTQRSGDIALGIPFNIACYTLLQRIIAQQVGLEVGEFGHTIVDAHIYCGKEERGNWWKENQEELADKINSYYSRSPFATDWEEDVIEAVISDAPEDPDNLDHVPGLLEQINRKSRQLPEIEIADKGIDEIEFDDIELKEYDPHPAIKFGVAE